MNRLRDFGNLEHILINWKHGSWNNQRCITNWCQQACNENGKRREMYLPKSIQIDSFCPSTHTHTYLNSKRIHFIAAFALHLILYGIQMIWRHFNIIRSNVAGMNKIRWISNHRTINSQSLMMWPSSGRTLRLMKATSEPLNPNVSRAGHFFIFHSANGSIGQLQNWNDKFIRIVQCLNDWRSLSRSSEMAEMQTSIWSTKVL